MDGNSPKRFKQNSVFDLSLNPVPKNLQTCLQHISQRFPSTWNLDILKNGNGARIYGLMTCYAEKNFCWVQPTLTKSLTSDHEYDQYIKNINTRNNSYYRPSEIKVGMDCIAKYSADFYWYRAIVVKQIKLKWLVMFIDYGNFQICDPEQIAEPIVEKDCNHYTAPVQAICCRLYNIVPTLPWLREDVDSHLETFFTKRSKYYLEIVVRDIRHDHVVDCDIFLPKAKADGPDRLYRRHLGQELVEAGFASFADPIAANAIKLSNHIVNKYNPDQMDFTEICHTPVLLKIA